MMMSSLSAPVQMPVALSLPVAIPEPAPPPVAEAAPPDDPAPRTAVSDLLAQHSAAPPAYWPDPDPDAVDAAPASTDSTGPAPDRAKDAAPEPPTPMEEASLQAQRLAAEAAYRMQALFDSLIAQGLEARPGAAVALSMLIAGMTPLPPAPGLTAMPRVVTEARKL